MNNIILYIFYYSAKYEAKMKRKSRMIKSHNGTEKISGDFSDKPDSSRYSQEFSDDSSGYSDQLSDVPINESDSESSGSLVSETPVCSTCCICCMCARKSRDNRSDSHGLKTEVSYLFLRWSPS